MNSLINLLLVALHLLPFISCAQSPAIRYYFDNDLLFITENEDRDYTLGMGISLLHGKNQKPSFYYPLEKIDNFFGLEKLFPSLKAPLYRTNFEVKLFTPDDLQSRRPIYVDRPYASIFSLRTTREVKDFTRGLFLESSFEVGLLGFFGARRLQSGAHFLVRELRNTEDPFEPLGWGNQISRGGEPTLKYGLSIRKRLDRFTWRNVGKPELLHFQPEFLLRANLGYQTDLSSGMNFRLGWIRTPSSGKGFFMHFGLESKWVLYNALLQGQFRTSEHVLSYAQLKKLVYQGKVGLTYQGRGWDLDYSLFVRTREYDPTDHGLHYWGALRVGFWK